MNERKKEQTNQRTNEPTNEQTNKQTNEPTNERTDVRMVGRTDRHQRDRQIPQFLSIRIAIERYINYDYYYYYYYYNQNMCWSVIYILRLEAVRCKITVRHSPL